MKNFLGRAIAAALAPAMPYLAQRFMRGAVPWATYNYKGGVLNGSGSGPAYHPAPISVVEIKVDFAEIAADRAAESQTALAANDVLQLVGVAAGTWVPMVAVQVVTPEGEAGTVDVGDTDVDGFIDGLDANTAGWGSSLVTTAYSVATAGGKLYTADDTIDMTLLTATYDTAVLRVFVPMVDLRGVRD